MIDNSKNFPNGKADPRALLAKASKQPLGAGQHSLDFEEDEPLDQPEALEDESELVREWFQEIADSRKREKTFRKKASEVTSIYEAEDSHKHQFNILFSNTETLQPALYNVTPRPVVKRRFNDKDPMGLEGARLGRRLLEFMLDNGDATYRSFDALMENAVLEALVPGRGVTRFKYDAELDPETQQPLYEQVCGEEIPWDRFCHGYGKKWQDVPWIAIDHYMTRQELIDNFGEVGATIKLGVSSDGLQDSQPDKLFGGHTQKDAEGTDLAWVPEIWDKTSGEVLFLAEGHDRVLKRVPDPLGLQGFFPCPQPLSFIAKVSSLTPIPPYQVYEAQAKELNIVTVRINAIVKALKVRGAYNSSIEGFDKILEAEDNIMVPIDNVAQMEGAALDKALWLMPIEKLVTVLQQLYTQRSAIKQVIYELTGIADIMRGSSSASETLGAQKIKNQWGTLRMKRAQKLVARYARDSMRIMLEIGVSKLSPQTVLGMTGLKYPTKQEQAQAQAMVQEQQRMQQAQAQQAAMMAQVTGQQPPPPQPPAPPPPELQAKPSSPAIEDLLELLRNDQSRNYRIDVETNSTVDAEATEDKELVSEFLNAMAQFFNGVGPLIQSKTLPFEAAKGIMLAVAKRFRFEQDVEEHLQAMKEPEAPPNPDEGKQKLEAAKAEQEMKLQAADAQHSQELARMNAQSKQMDLQLKAAEHKMKLEELTRKGQFLQLQYQLKEATLRAQVQAAHAMPKKPDRITGE